MTNVILKESHEPWTEENVFEAVVRLKQDELFHGRAKRDNDKVEVRIPTQIPDNDYNTSVTLNDNGETVIGRIVSGTFHNS